MSEYILERVSSGDYRYCLGSFYDCRNRPKQFDRLKFSVFVISEYIAIKDNSDFTFSDVIYELYELQNIICNIDKSEFQELVFHLLKIRDNSYYVLNFPKYNNEKCIETDFDILGLFEKLKSEKVPDDYISKYNHL